jgi:hypothetical protein
MSKKTELINLFMEYKSRYEAVYVQVTEINRNPAYTELGREQAVRRTMDGFAPTVQLYHDKVVNVINAGLDRLAETWKKSSAGKLLDSGYQAGLSNVIKMLEIGAIREREDIQNIIDTYAGDFNALSVIAEILKNSGDEVLRSYASLVPEDNREKNRRLLNQLRENVDIHINLNTLQNTASFDRGLTSVSMGIDGMSTFVRDRLGDNLELLN